MFVYFGFCVLLLRMLNYCQTVVKILLFVWLTQAYINRIGKVVNHILHHDEAKTAAAKHNRRLRGVMV